jgi:hypothetical protein
LMSDHPKSHRNTSLPSIIASQSGLLKKDL